MRMFSKRTPMRRIVILTIAAFVAVSFLAKRVMTVMYDISTARAKYITTLEINAVTSQYLTRCAEMYNDILVKDKSPDGQITAINTDISKINRMQSEITQQVLNRLDKEGVYDMTLPLMNVLGMNTLTAVGPRFQMELSPASNVSARFEDSFVSAGINQTKFSVNLIVDVDVTVSVSPIRSKIHVSHSIPIVQLILMGGVPETYADIQR